MPLVPEAMAAFIAVTMSVASEVVEPVHEGTGMPRIAAASGARRSWA